MKHSPVRSLLKAFAKFSLVAAAAIGLSGCGGSSGRGGAAQVIAPESMDELEINFFNAFTLRLFRLSGQRGNEFGAVEYRNPRDFFLGIPGTGGGPAIGRTVVLPNVLSDIRYSYRRTSVDTGTLTLTWQVEQVYPFNQATENNPRVIGAEMFWFGTSDGIQQVSVDLLFTDNGGTLGDRIARITEAVFWDSFWIDGAAQSFRTSVPFDTDRVDTQLLSFRTLAGGPVPTGYDPYTTIDQNAPVAAVWTSMRNPETGRARVVRFLSADRFTQFSKISFLPNPVANPPALPSGTPDEVGTILIEDAQVAGNTGGAYSYRRTGGDRAMLAIRFTNSNNVEVVRTYDMDFDSFDSGVFLMETSAAVGSTIGVFAEEFDRPF